MSADNSTKLKVTREELRKRTREFLSKFDVIDSDTPLSPITPHFSANNLSKWVTEVCSFHYDQKGDFESGITAIFENIKKRIEEITSQDLIIDYVIRPDKSLSVFYVATDLNKGNRFSVALININRFEFLKVNIYCRRIMCCSNGQYIAFVSNSDNWREQLENEIFHSIRISAYIIEYIRREKPHIIQSTTAESSPQSSTTGADRPAKKRKVQSE